MLPHFACECKTLQVVVHKKDDQKVPALYKNLPTPLLENDNEWCWHGERLGWPLSV